MAVKYPPVKMFEKRAGQKVHRHIIYPRKASLTFSCWGLWVKVNIGRIGIWINP
jgi:hypothetical protein